MIQLDMNISTITKFSLFILSRQRENWFEIGFEAIFVNVQILTF